MSFLGKNTSFSVYSCLKCGVINSILGHRRQVVFRVCVKPVFWFFLSSIYLALPSFQLWRGTFFLLVLSLLLIAFLTCKYHMDKKNCFPDTIEIVLPFVISQYSILSSWPKYLDCTYNSYYSNEIQKVFMSE